MTYQNAGNRCLFVFMTLLWSTFFVATIVLYQVIDAYPGMVKKADTDPRARLYRAKEMVNILKEMRQGDYRLVRPSPSDETQIEQHRYCPYKIHAFLMTLCTSTATAGRSKGKMAVSLHKRGIAAEALGMCFTNAPEFRDAAANATFLSTELTAIQQGQLVAHNLAQGLQVVLQEGIKHYHTTRDGAAVVAMHQAAETAWIASFHHPTHIQNMLDAKIIDVLAEIIVSTRPEELASQKLEHGYHPARAVMWAAAALQNLAASYCDNDLGHCLWEYNDQGKLVLDEEHTRLEAPELAEQARQEIANQPQLLETLADWVCQGPIHAKPNATYGWPGDAILWKDLTFNSMSPHLQSPSIVPWAAAGVFKNMLLTTDPELKQRITTTFPHLSECLCDLTQSPDWLEQSKSSEALRRWGPEPLCPDIYQNCRDDPEWENAESGDTCEDYEKERWCVEYGEDVGANGKTARQACCACGGGEEVQGTVSETPAVADENTTSQATTEGDIIGKAAVEMEAGEIPEEHVAGVAADSAHHEEL